MTTYRVVFTTETSCRVVADEGTGEAITFTSLAHAQAFADGLNGKGYKGYSVQEIEPLPQQLWAVTGGYQSPDFRPEFYYHEDCNGLDAPKYLASGGTIKNSYKGVTFPVGGLCGR